MKCLKQLTTENPAGKQFAFFHFHKHFRCWSNRVDEEWFWTGIWVFCLYYSCDYCRVFSCDYAGMLDGAETTFSRVNKACRNMFNGDYFLLR